MIKVYTKLVRDNIPEIIKQDGGIPRYKNITDKNELLNCLTTKLCEEASELNTAVSNADPGNIIEEIADVYEVIDSSVGLIQELYGFSLMDICAVQKRKREERGSFKNGTYIIEADYPNV